MDNLKNSPEIQSLVMKMKEFFFNGMTQSYDFRLNQLKKLKKSIQENEQEVFSSIKKDLGRSDIETYMAEIRNVHKELDYTIKNLKKLMRPVKVHTSILHKPAKSIIYHEPYGCVLIIGPWNYPFQLTIQPLIGAIAAGNCVIIKPSEVSENTSHLINKIISSTFNSEYIAVVEGGISETQELLKNRFDHIFYTGGTKVGKVIMSVAASFLTPVTLELGGKSPTIVEKSASFEASANKIIWGKFFNAGQTCVAPDYLLVEESIKEDFLKILIKNLKSFFGDDPAINANYGRIINKTHCNRLINYLKGNEILYGGVYSEEDLYISPTIINTDLNNIIMEEEIFGPILPVLSYKNFDELKNIISKNPDPLSLYVFSRNKKFQEQIIKEIPYGNGCINDIFLQLDNPKLPFGGRGPSGIGSYHGNYSFYSFSHKKSIFKKATCINFPLKFKDGELKYLDLNFIRFIDKIF